MLQKQKGIERVQWSHAKRSLKTLNGRPRLPKYKGKVYELGQWQERIRPRQHGGMLLMLSFKSFSAGNWTICPVLYGFKVFLIANYINLLFFFSLILFSRPAYSLNATLALSKLYPECCSS